MLGRLIVRLLKPYLHELLTISVKMVYAPYYKGANPVTEPPRYAHVGDAGIDLAANVYATIRPGQQSLIPTGVRMAIPEGFVGIVKDRSSIARARVYTHGGVIDAGYRGEISVLLENRSDIDLDISPGHRIAQLLIVPVARVDLAQVETLDSTERGEGGFGSTGK